MKGRSVRIITCPVAGDDDGEVSILGTEYTVKISNARPFAVRVDTLIHEYAHCLDKFERHRGDHDKEHGSAWGEKYSQLYIFIRNEADRLNG